MIRRIITCALALLWAGAVWAETVSPAGVTIQAVKGWRYTGATSGSTLLQAAPVASGTLTLPAATDTLVGRATVDTLTNKAIDAGQLTGTVAAARLPYGAWTDFTPVPSAASGTVTTWGAHVGRYQQIGKTVHVAVIIRITTNGTGAGQIQVPLPVTPRAGWRGGCSGWRGDNSSILGGFTYSDYGSTTLTILGPNSTYPGANGAELWFSCTYEAA